MSRTSTTKLGTTRKKSLEERRAAKTKYQAEWRKNNPERNRANVAKLYARNRERDLALQFARRQQPKGRANHLIASAAARARKGGFSCVLSASNIQKRLAAGICEATGLRLDFSTGNGSRSPRAPSLDRINPKKGYTQRNTAVVCWQYNAAKQNFDAASVVEMAHAIVSRVSA